MDSQNYNQQEKIKDKQIDAGIKNYTGPEGISTKQLEYGLWYVEHKRQLIKVVYGFLILVSAVSWVYTIYGFAYYIARGMNEDEILTRQLLQANSIGHDYVKQISAKQMSLTPVEVIQSANQKYDLFAKLKNDNEKWWAEFDYYFAAAGEQTDKVNGYILPLEDKYLSALAREFASMPQDAQLIMENLRWRRINQHEIADWPAFYKSHLDIESADIKFIPAGGQEKLNQLNFKVINHTAYNYWEVGFTILLTSGSNIVNINHYGLADFMSGQSRSVAINWAGNIGAVDKVEIIPEINIMKNDIYIPFEGGIGQEK